MVAMGMGNGQRSSQASPKDFAYKLPQKHSYNIVSPHSHRPSISTQIWHARCFCEGGPRKKLPQHNESTYLYAEIILLGTFINFSNFLGGHKTQR